VSILNNPTCDAIKYGTELEATVYVLINFRIHINQNSLFMQKLMFIAAIAATLFLSSCDKDDESGQLSKTDAKAEIAEFNSSATTDLQALADADGLNALSDLSLLVDTDDPFGRVTTDRKKLRTFLRQKGHQFRSIFEQNDAGRVKGSEPFDYNLHKGVYEWNFAEEVFVKTGASTIIQIKFPTEGSVTNNGELKLKAYQEVHVYNEEFAEHSYEPTLLDAEVWVDAVKAASLNLTMEWDDNGFPLTADMTATVSPFTATLAFDITGSTKNTISASILRNTETLFASAITVNYADASKSEESLKSIEGYFQLKNLKLQGSVNFTELNSGSGDVDINDFVKLALYSDGKKLGTVVFVTEMVDGFEETAAYLKYADGSKEKLEVVLQPVVDELNQLSEDLG
jgi:hypothetical protein